MEYKIFGAGGSPGDGFTPDLQAFCRLDEVQREALAIWFESTSDYDTYTPELPPSIVRSSLLPEQFRKTAAPILYLLDSWHRRSLEIADIERDLLLLGLNQKQIALTTSFLLRLSPVKERVWLDGLEGTAQNVGLPTLDDANIVWDARPFFGGPSYYHFGGDADQAMYKHCLGLTCMAIVELMISDRNGTKQRIAVQMNENVFKMFLRAVNRADDQLGSLKAFIKPLTVDAKG
jgi:hypothetical protein